jgi:hypothetical protein
MLLSLVVALKTLVNFKEICYLYNMGKQDTLALTTGRLGNLVIYRVGNQLRTRTLPGKINMPQTEGVIQAKSQFKRINALARLIYLKTAKMAGPQIHPDSGENAYSGLIKLIRWSLVSKDSSTQSTWNWPNLTISEGKLPQLHAQLSEKAKTLSFTWNVSESESMGDWVYVIGVDAQHETVFVQEFDFELGKGSIDKKKCAPHLKGDVQYWYVFRAVKSNGRIKKTNSDFAGETQLNLTKGEVVATQEEPARPPSPQTEQLTLF